MPHTHQCPHCGTKWECDDGNYQDEYPYPTETPRTTFGPDGLFLGQELVT
jgi:hypothetical protein